MADVALAALDLPDAQASRAFRSPEAVAGRLVVAPVAEGELVQASAVTDRSKADARYQVSFPIDRSRALDGAVSPGEQVDLLATYGGAAGDRTIVVARRAEVVRVDDARRSSISAGGDIVVVVALPSPDDVLAVTHASQSGKLTVVRATGVGAGTADGPSSYEPPR